MKKQSESNLQHQSNVGDRRITDHKKYIDALRQCAKEHDYDITFTGHIIVSDLCRDTANLLEELEHEPSRNMEEIKEVMNSAADAETKCKMISNILRANPHYFEEDK